MDRAVQVISVGYTILNSYIFSIDLKTGKESRSLMSDD